MITLEDAKAWIRVDIDDDDALILSLVEAAKQYILGALDYTPDETNEIAKLLCKIIVAEWYDARAMTDFRSEKVRFTVSSMMLQLQHGGDS